MDGAKETGHARALAAFLAGVQAGWVGVFAMLLWLGVSAAWQQRSFWTAENLMASLFWGNNAIHAGFAGQTVSGLAVYLLLYSLLGGVLAWAVRDRLARIRVLMVSLVFALAWYYLSYRLLWRAVAPLIPLLHVERATVLGHLVYGTLLGRYPVYLAGPPAPVATAPPAAEEAAPAEAAAAETVVADTVVADTAAAAPAEPGEPPAGAPVS